MMKTVGRGEGETERQRETETHRERELTQSVQGHQSYKMKDYERGKGNGVMELCQIILLPFLVELWSCKDEHVSVDYRARNNPRNQ